MRLAFPELLARVSRRDIALSPIVWSVVWGTFAMLGLGAAIVGGLGWGGVDQRNVLVLAAALIVIATAMSRMAPPEPDRARTHALLALTYVGPMFAMIAFGPQGSAVAVTTAFAAPLTSVWVVDRRQIAAHLAAATLALFVPWIVGAVDQGSLATSLVTAPVMWTLAITCVAVLEAAEAQGEELARLVKRDPLTGAGNRRLLDEELHVEVSRHHHGQRPFSLLTFDLNGFKALNDTVGHAAGDELLKATADVLMRTARPHDTVVRQGGDEFCMLLPATSAQDARVLAELVRARLEAVRAFGSGISTGIGVATCPADGRDEHTLLAVADERLRADKAAAPQRDAGAWRDHVPEVEPRANPSAESEPAVVPAWTAEGVSRRHLEGMHATWRAAGASSLLYAVIGVVLLLWAPQLGRPGLEYAVALPIVGAAVLFTTSPPPIGTVRNHLYVSIPYVLPAVFALFTTPGTIALALSMFVGPLAAVRLIDRRQIAAHLAAATVVFLAVMALRLDDFPTVLSLVIVIGNLWVLGFCCIVVLEASEAQGRELAKLVRRDPLTGLGNRRRLQERLDEELARHRASGKPLTVVTLDLDGFKQVNDTVGHAAGDEVLVRVAAALRVIATEPAEAMRQGGDEFALLLPDTTIDEARAATAAIRRSLGTITEQGVQVTTGVGVAAFPEDGDDARELLDRADHRLRSDKYGEVTPPPRPLMRAELPDAAARTESRPR